MNGVIHLYYSESVNVDYVEGINNRFIVNIE